MNNYYGYKYLVLCLFFGLFLSQSLFGQSSRELKSDQLIEEYEQFKTHRLTDIPRALEHAKKAYDLSIELADSIYIGKSSRAMGWLIGLTGEYDTAFYYLEKSILISNASKDLNQLKFVYNDAGLNRLNLGIYDEALDYFNKSLKIKDELKDYAGKISSYNNMGLVYYNLEDFNKAIDFFKKGLAISEEFANTSAASMNLVNIGLSYLLLEQYENAQKYFEKTLNSCLQDCPIDVKIQAIGGMGIIYFHLEQYDKAYLELDRVIDVSVQNDVIRFLPSNYHYLALIEYEQKEFEKALDFLNTSDSYAHRLQNAEWKKNNLGLYAKLYASMEDYKQAYDYEVRYVNAKDSLLNADVVKSISDIHVNIQQDKDATIILGKDLQISERNQQLILFAVTVFLSMILVLLLYRINKLRQRINKKLDYQVQERTKILNKTNEALIDSRTELDNFIYKISHDIQGPLATLKGVCDIGLIEVKDKTGREYLTRLNETAVELNGVIHRLQTVNQIISTTLDYAEVDFESLVHEAIEGERKQSSEYDGIVTEVDIQDDLDFKTDPDLISIVINNLISNAFHFYDTQKKRCVIEVRIYRKEDDLIVEVRDNGIGIELEDTKELFRMFSRFSDRNRTGGIGLFLVKTAVDKLSGKISVNRKEDDQFTTFEVALPYKTERKGDDYVIEAQSIIDKVEEVES